MLKLHSVSILAEDTINIHCMLQAALDEAFAAAAADPVQQIL